MAVPQRLFGKDSAAVPDYICSPLRRSELPGIAEQLGLSPEDIDAIAEVIADGAGGEDAALALNLLAIEAGKGDEFSKLLQDRGIAACYQATRDIIWQN